MSDETAIGPAGAPDRRGHPRGSPGEQSPLQARAAFLKPGVGSSSSASIEERAQGEARSTAMIQRAMERLKQSGAADNPKPPPSPKP